MIPAINELLDELNDACSRTGASCRFDGQLLLERAGLSALGPVSQQSRNGTCRILRCRDAWVAVTLSRARDVEFLPAWLGESIGEDPWACLQRHVADRAAHELVSAGRLLGFAVARVAPPAQSPAAVGVKRIAARGPARGAWGDAPPVVVDLSALWAGPLCGHILAACGAEVIKVESRQRRDVAHSDFFRKLNAAKRTLVLDFDADRQSLLQLIAGADLVIGSARPRAFEQLELIPEVLVAANPGLSWVAITAYGWHGADNNAVGFGDDVAAAAGLVGWSPTGPQFLGDAIADPLTGICAATAAIDAICCGGGVLIDSSLFACASRVSQALNPSQSN